MQLRPMWVLALALGGLSLAACDTFGPAPEPAEPEVVVSPLRQDAFVTFAEQSGCRIHPVDHAPLHEAGFSDTELVAIGQDLIEQGRAQRTIDGELVLTTEACL
jgi:hypothetical protein